MEAAIIREALAKVIEKHNLPELKVLDRELEMVDMLSERRELPQDILAAIRRRFTEVVYSWINFVHSLVVPSPQSLIVNKDAEAFDEKEKDSVYKVMAILAKMTRESAYFEIEKGQKKEEAKFIRENFSKFMELKKKLAEFNIKVVEHWKKEAS